jgi:hypothetical protein
MTESLVAGWFSTGFAGIFNHRLRAGFCLNRLEKKSVLAERGIALPIFVCNALLALFAGCFI